MDQLPPEPQAPAPADVPWTRLLYMLFFMVVFEVVEILTFASAVFQFVLAKASGHSSPGLADFGRRMGPYAQEVIAYLTFAREEPPYPFGQ